MRLSSYDAVIGAEARCFVEIDEPQREILTDLSRMIERFVVYHALGDVKEHEIMIITLQTFFDCRQSLAKCFQVFFSSKNFQRTFENKTK